MSKTAAYIEEPIADDEVRGAYERATSDLAIDVGALVPEVSALGAAARLSEQLEHLVNPPWMKAMLQTQEQWQRAMNPFGNLGLGLAGAAAASLGRHSDFGFHHDLVASALGRSGLAALQHEHLQARDMAERFGLGMQVGFDAYTRAGALMEAALPHRLLAERISAFDSSALRGFQHSVLGLESKGLSTWAAVDHLTQAFGVDSMLGETFDRVGSVARAFEKLLPESVHAQWSSHWRDTTLPALSLLARDCDRPWGLLMELPNPELGASLSWLTRRREQPRISRAALSSAASGDDAVEVIIECEPECSICGGPLLSFKSTIKWIGPKLGLRNRRVFPACARCSQAEREDPGFLQRSLPTSESPSLGIKREVIKGGGTGDGRPSARLRVVRNRQD